MKVSGIPKYFTLGTMLPVTEDSSTVTYETCAYDDASPRILVNQLFDLHDDEDFTLLERQLDLADPRDLAVLEADAAMFDVSIGGKDGAPLRLDLLMEAMSGQYLEVVRLRSFERKPVVLLSNWNWKNGHPLYPRPQS